MIKNIFCLMLLTAVGRIAIDPLLPPSPGAWKVLHELPASELPEGCSREDLLREEAWLHQALRIGAREYQATAFPHLGSGWRGNYEGLHAKCESVSPGVRNLADRVLRRLQVPLNCLNLAEVFDRKTPMVGGLGYQHVLLGAVLKEKKARSGEQALNKRLLITYDPWREGIDFRGRQPDVSHHPGGKVTFIEEPAHLTEPKKRGSALRCHLFIDEERLTHEEPLADAPAERLSQWELFCRALDSQAAGLCVAKGGACHRGKCECEVLPPKT